MKSLLLVFSFFSFTCQLGLSQDTFSIVAVDPETGEVGSAGASCVDNIAGLGGIQLLNKIIPGKGGVNAQAYVCINPHINLDNAIDQMNVGLSPEEIISWLEQNDACFSQNFNPAYRQYGIVDLDEMGNPRVAAFTGTLTDDYKGHITGPNYAIQGNILLGPQVLEQMEAGFLNTTGTLAEKLMGAMQGANIPGADSRCLARGTSSTSAFLRVVKADDNINSPFLELNVLEMPFGEEPIDSLQSLFDSWILTSTDEPFASPKRIKVFPNPSSGKVFFETTNGLLNNDWELRLFDLTGKLVRTIPFTGSSLILNRSQLPNGSLFIYTIHEPETGDIQQGKLMFVD